VASCLECQHAGPLEEILSAPQNHRILVLLYAPNASSWFIYVSTARLLGQRGAGIGGISVDVNVIEQGGGERLGESAIGPLLTADSALQGRIFRSVL